LTRILRLLNRHVAWGKYQLLSKVRAADSITRRVHTVRTPSWPDRETSRLLNAIECIYAHDDLATFHICVFRAISGLVKDVVLSLDCTRLRDGRAESRNTKEGTVPQEMQSLLLLLFPENPAAPALRKGARGVLNINDFVTQREFERTALYNEIMRPIDVRYQLLVPLDVPGYVATVSINRHSHFSRDEIRKLRPSPPSRRLECAGSHEPSGFCFRCPTTRTAPRSWSHSAGVSCHALANSGQA
jgi:hypothetical protein